jgi:hypothetical protein
METQSSSPNAHTGTNPHIGTNPAMHDKCKNVILFHNNLCKFFKSLKGILPECLPQIKAAMTEYKAVSRVEYLNRLQTSMSPHIQRVSEYDEGIFTEDYVRGPLNLLPGLDFKKIWEVIDSPDFQGDLRASTVRSIFNHLQTVYVSAEMALSQVSAFNRALDKQKEFLMNMLGNLKLDEQLKAKVEELRAQEAAAGVAAGGAGVAGLGGMGGLLGGLLGNIGSTEAGAGLAEIFNGADGEDNFIYKLAKEIAEELDMGSQEISDPLAAITALFAEDGRKMRELIVSVGERLDRKVKSGEFDMDRLRSDAMAMKERLEKAVPGLQNLIPGNPQSASPAGLVQMAYDALGDEEKVRWNMIPDILQRPIESWNAEEQSVVDDFCRSQMEGERANEEALPDEELPKPAPKKGKAKSKVGAGPRATQGRGAAHK